jgi:RND family efflux transporter MFP subunit
MRVRDWPRAFVIGFFWTIVTLLNLVILPARHALHVTAEAVKMAPLELVVRAPGSLDAKDSASVKAQFEGEIVSKHFHEGQTVKAGQLLVVLNRDKIRMDYQQKQDAVINAKADLAQAKKEIRLQKTLFSKQAVAHSAVEEADRNLVRANQALRAAEQAALMEQAIWDSARVVSPIAGTVVKDDIGEDKNATNGKGIATIADVSQFTVKARVDELDIKRVAENQPAEVRIQIYPQRLFKARVTQVGSQPESADSTAIPVVLALEDMPGILLRPKLTADVRIITGQAEPGLSVPLSAINNADGSTRVWVLGLGDRLKSRAVTLGQTNPDRVEVTHGLRPGERVCTTADTSLAEGMRVYVGKAGGSGGSGSLVRSVRSLWGAIMKAAR